MAPKYKLTYFDLRGRGEFIRLILAAAKVDYVDERIKGDDWPALKPKTPQGSMPILEIVGSGKKLVQTFAIARYLAREYKLYGKDNYSMAIVDTILETGIDLMNVLIPIFFNKDEEDKKKKMATFQSENLPNYLKYIEALISETGKKGYAVGDSLTIADISINGVLDLVKDVPSLDSYPKVKDNKKTFEADSKLKDYLAKRK